MDYEDEFVQLPRAKGRELEQKPLTHLPPAAETSVPVVQAKVLPEAAPEPEEKVTRIEVAAPAEAAAGAGPAVKLAVHKRPAPFAAHAGKPLLVEAQPQAAPMAEEVWGEGGGKSQLKLLMPWLAACLVLLLGCVIWAVMKEFSSIEEQQERAEVSNPAAVAPVVPQALDPDQDANEDLQARRMLGRMEELVRAYLAAPDPKALLNYVRSPELVAAKMDLYYQRHPYTRRSFEALGGIVCIDVDAGTNYWRVRLLKDGRESGELLVTESNANGELKIDWELDVGYQPMAWDEYVKQRPPGRYDFRVQIQPGSLYSHEFADEKSISCLNLVGQGGEEILYGYMARDSRAAQLLHAALDQNKGKPIRVMLRLRVPENLKSPRGCVIEEILSFNWWYAKPPQP